MILTSIGQKIESFIKENVQTVFVFNLRNYYRTGRSSQIRHGKASQKKKIMAQLPHLRKGQWILLLLTASNQFHLPIFTHEACIKA